MRAFPALFVILILTSACARLPEYAQPRISPAPDDQKTRPAGFPYRQLGPQDFRADAVREHLSGHSEKINAHSEIQIRLTPASRFSITHGELFGRRYFFGRIDHLAFEAVMIPEGSWWNPGIPAAMSAYVLEHEQIHFALTEIAARRLTLDTAQWAPNVLVIRETPHEVQSEMGQQIKEVIKAAMIASLKRHAEFDEGTSLFYNPRKQQWWLWEVEEELKHLERTLPEGGRSQE